MGSVAVGIMCKTPEPGKSKTRLSPPLRPEECAGLSACFIRDLSQTIARLAEDGDVTGYAVYTPVGSEEALRRLLPAGFELMPQVEGDFDYDAEAAPREKSTGWHPVNIGREIE